MLLDSTVRAGALRRRIPALAALLALACMLVFAGWFAPLDEAWADEDTVGIAIAPSDGERRDGRNRFSYRAEAGQSVTDHVLVRNVGSVRSTITVSANDAYNSDDGKFSLEASGETPDEAGSWVSFGGKSSVTMDMDPQEARTLEFTVTAPDNVTPGDHAAGIVASVAAQGEGDVLVERRIAVRMYVRVPGDLKPDLRVTRFDAEQDFSLNPLDAPVTLHMTIENAGNVALRGRAEVALRTWFGIEIAGQVVDVDEMLPGSSREVTVRFDENVGQPVWLAPHLSLQPLVDDDALDPGPLTVVVVDGFLWSVPWTVIVVLLVLVLIIVLRVRSWRRRRRAAARDQAADATLARVTGGATPAATPHATSDATPSATPNAVQSAPAAAPASPVPPAAESRDPATIPRRDGTGDGEAAPGGSSEPTPTVGIPSPDER